MDAMTDRSTYPKIPTNSVHPVPALDASLRLKRKAGDVFLDPIPRSPTYEDFVRRIELHERDNEHLQNDKSALGLERQTAGKVSCKSKILTTQPQYRKDRALEYRRHVEDVLHSLKQTRLEDPHMLASQEGRSVTAKERRFKLPLQLEDMSEELRKPHTSNEGLQVAAGSIAQDKLKVEESIQEFDDRVQSLTAERNTWQSLYHVSNIRSTKIESELKSSLDENLRKVKSLTEELGRKDANYQALTQLWVNTKKTNAMQDSEIQRLEKINEEQRISAAIKEATLASLRTSCERLQTSNQVYQQHTQQLESLFASQEEELQSLRILSDKLNGRVKDLESSAVERTRLQEANAKSRKVQCFICLEPMQKADTTVVRDFAAYFTKKSSENVESLESLFSLAPAGGKDVRMILELALEKEQDIEIMADVLKQHGRIIDERG
jgi:hypothetical protein